MNAVVYQVASFMLVRNPVVWRASHVRHHTDTIVVGRDPEIVTMRPPDLMRVALNLFGIIDTLPCGPAGIGDSFLLNARITLDRKT